MSDLTATEKEQVAALLGWTKCLTHESSWVRPEQPVEHIVCMWTWQIVTLEACMEYAKGKGWEWRMNTDVNGDGVVTAIFADLPVSSIAPDPLTAFVRALLKAEAAL